MLESLNKGLATRAKIQKILSFSEIIAVFIIFHEKIFKILQKSETSKIHISTMPHPKLLFEVADFSSYLVLHNTTKK